MRLPVLFSTLGPVRKTSCSFVHNDHHIKGCQDGMVHIEQIKMYGVCVCRCSSARS